VSHRIYLLDTSVILPLVRGNALGKHIDQRFGLQASAQRPFVSVVSLGEVRVLAKRNDWGDRCSTHPASVERDATQGEGATRTPPDTEATGRDEVVHLEVSR